MPLIRNANAPTFTLPGLAVRGLAAPSRGSSDNSVWHLTLAPGTPGVLHTMDREEIFVALSGVAIATVGDERTELHAGDALIIPPGELFSLANESAEPFAAVALVPVGSLARIGSDDSFAPPWTL